MRSLAALGTPSLVAAFLFSSAAFGFFVASLRSGRTDLQERGRRAVTVSAGFVAAAAGALITALYAHDFSLAYVAGYSSRSLAGPYLLSALWGGMEGSLLLWTLFLVVFSALALTTAPRRPSALTAGAGAVLSVIACFFILMVLAPANPFARLSEVPADGSGLNPLLQSPGMLIHPPLLYLGFVGFSIPFAFAVAALLTKRLDGAWLTATRRWTLFAWSALSVGIVLGAAWAYTELGWGGYWAWDPVENASFLPWLTATAYLHSVVIQEKRRMLGVWNLSLIVATYVLAVFGTFLTRSGILSSIHTFSEGPVGVWFLPFLGVTLVAGAALIAWRLDALASPHRLESPLSREAAFLAQNVLLVAAAGTILWGTLYPLVAEVVTGSRVAVGPPFFNAVFAPIALAVVALMGIGPLLSWRRTSKRPLARNLAGPLLAGCALILVLSLGGMRSFGALLAFGLCAFTAAAIGGEFARGSRSLRRRSGKSWVVALAGTIARNRRRYGGYVVHLGVLLIAIGVIGGTFHSERQAVMQPGDSMRIEGYTLTYAGFTESTTREKLIDEVRIGVTAAGDEVTTLEPQRNFHFAQRQPQSEVAIHSTVVEDLYVVITSFSKDGTAAVRAFVNPLTFWIWAGGFIVAAGASILLSERRRARAPERAPVEQREPAVVA